MYVSSSALKLAALLSLATASVAYGAPAPTPTPTLAASKLKLIGRVRALSPFCSQTISHADAAISSALENDARIAFTVSNLRSTDLDSSSVKKADGTRQMLKDYTALRQSAVTAEAAIRELRADADAAKDPEQKTDLRAFADALGGALERQKKMADELSRTIAYVDAHARIDENQKQQFLFDIQWAQTVPGNPYHGNPQDYVPPTLTEVAHSAADRLTEQQTGVAADEGRASERVEPAFKGCL